MVCSAHSLGTSLRSVLKAPGLIVHLGSACKHTQVKEPVNSAELADPSLTPHALSARVVGRGHQEAFCSVWYCTSKCYWGAARWKKAWKVWSWEPKPHSQVRVQCPWEDLVNLCHADWQVFGKSLSGYRQICPRQNWRSWRFTCPAVSRWEKKVFQS